MAESISEGTLKTWQKKVGDTVAADEEIATIETDKVSTAPPSQHHLFFLSPVSVLFILLSRHTGTTARS
jgi:hypothetical protein